MKRLFWLIVLSVAAAFLISPVTDYINRQAHPIKYSEFVTKYSQEYDVPKPFIYAVIKNESSFKPDATSSIGARGLMQITDVAYDWVNMRSGFDNSFDDMYDPETNIRYGTYMLKLLLEEFKTEENALCAYHAGWGVAQKWLKNEEYSPDKENITNIPYPDTKWYVQNVSKSRKIYEKLYFKGE